MSKKTFRIISGITTAVAAAGVTIANLLGVSNGPVVSGVIVALAGCVDEICTLFIESDKQPTVTP